MKHNKYYFWALCMILTLSSCGNIEPTSDASSDMITDESSFVESDIAPESDVSDSSEKESDDPNWRVDYYVDEFGDTDYSSPFLRCNMIYGEFSNTAVNGAFLSVQPLGSAHSITFKLYEYGDHLVSNICSDIEKYKVIFKYDSGERKEYTGFYMSNSGTELNLHKDADKDLQERLKNGETIRIYVENIEYPICNYLFVVDGKGYKEAFEEYEPLWEIAREKFEEKYLK